MAERGGFGTLLEIINNKHGKMCATADDDEAEITHTTRGAIAKSRKKSQHIDGQTRMIDGTEVLQIEWGWGG